MAGISLLAVRTTPTPFGFGVVRSALLVAAVRWRGFL